MVGLLPLCATTIVEPTQRAKMPKPTAQFQERLRHMPELRKSIHPTGAGHYGVAERGIIAPVNQDRLRRILTRVLAPIGIPLKLFGFSEDRTTDGFVAQKDPGQPIGDLAGDLE